MKEYVLKVGEEYGDTVVEYPNLWLSSSVDNYFSCNADLSREDYLDWDIGDYALESVSDLFLTNAPRPQSIELNQLAWVYMLQKNIANDPNKLQVITYDSAGSVIATTNFTSGYSTSSGDFTHLSFGVGTYQLNNSSAGTLIDSNTSYYTVQMLYDSTARSEVMRFNIVSGSCKYDTKRIHFLNKLGGYDSFNFSLVSKNNYNIERAEYTKNRFEFATRTAGDYNFYNSSTNAFYDYTLQSRGKSVFWQTVGETLKVTSDWITEEEATWLLELFTSRDIYLEADNGLVAMNIKATSYETKKKENEKLFNIEVEFEYAQPKW